MITFETNLPVSILVLVPPETFIHKDDVRAAAAWGVLMAELYLLKLESEPPHA